MENYNGNHNEQESQKLSMEKLLEEVGIAGGEQPIDIAFEGSVGVTMFDKPNSKDNLITVLVPKQHLGALPSQSLVSIKSRSDGDNREYKGIVIEGPFYEPDGLKADSNIIVTTAVNGLTFMPKYHAKVYIIGEVLNDRLVPPRFRPLPNSPVFPLNMADTKAALNVDGDITLGLAIGHENLEVNIPSDTKKVLPRHVGILGTTGGGKSTTVSGLVHRFQETGIATILVDTEGEYTHISKATTDETMLQILASRNKIPQGVKDVQILKLIGKGTTADGNSNIREFSLKFENLSPDMIMEILGLNDAQCTRYRKAYTLAREILRRLRIFPTTETERNQLMELDELEKSYPKLKLSMMYDIVQICARKIDKTLKDDDGYKFRTRSEEFVGREDEIVKIIESQLTDTRHANSWFKVQGELGRLLRLKIFDNPNADNLNYELLTTPGKVSILDLNETNSPQINNLVIAELLRGTLKQQNRNYETWVRDKSQVQNKTMVIIEEAHEFLSRERIKQMPALAQQVGSIGGVDDGLWQKLTNLSAGQAIVKTQSLNRALLVAIDPTPCELLMVD